MSTPIEKDVVVGTHTPDTGSKSESVQADHDHVEDFRAAAQQGHTATDNHGNALITIDPKAEARLRLKLDLMVVPTVALLYLFAFIDRANIGNARLAGLEKDLKLKGYDFNQLLSVFFISYILFEIPSNMACKYIGPGWYLPAITLAFGIISVCMAFVHTLEAACGVRFLLGVFEAGMMPGIAYYLSRWYRRSELSFRFSMFLVMSPLAGGFGGLLASGILKLDSFGSVTRWRMIFAIEGIITIFVALVAFVTMTDRPETAWWLSQEEKDLAAARLKIERVSTTEVLDKMDKKKLLRGIVNPNTLATGFVFLLNGISVHGISVFTPTIIATIYPRDTVISQQLHTVPPYAVSAVVLLAGGYASWRLDRRLIFFIISAPLMMIGYVMYLATDRTQAMIRYGGTFILMAGSFQFGALCNAQAAANVVSDSARSAALGTNVMMNTIGGLISTWSFLPGDAPNFPIGNGLNFATSATALLVSIGLYFWLKYDNRRRDRQDIDGILSGMDQQKIQELDWKHPGFRWKL